MAVHGFLEMAARIIYENSHGLSAVEGYRLVEQRFAKNGRPVSDAKDPQSSLTCTLHKYYKDHGLRRERGSRSVWNTIPPGLIEKRTTALGVVQDE